MNRKCIECGGDLELRKFVDSWDDKNKPVDIHEDYYCPNVISDGSGKMGHTTSTINFPFFLGCEEIRYVVGYAFVFENLVVYGNRSSLIHMLHGKRKKLGNYLGTVKGVIPYDPYHVLYQWIRDTPAYKRRQQERKILRKLGISRRKIKEYRKLTEWMK